VLSLAAEAVDDGSKGPSNTDIFGTASSSSYSLSDIQFVQTIS